MSNQKPTDVAPSQSTTADAQDSTMTYGTTERTPAPQPRAANADAIELGVRRILDQHHPELSASARDMVSRLARAEQWTGDVTKQLDAAVAAFGKQAITGGSSGSGAALSYGGGKPVPSVPAAPPTSSIIPDDMRQIDPSVWRALPREKQIEIRNKFLLNGGAGNRFAIAKGRR